MSDRVFTVAMPKGRLARQLAARMVPRGVPAAVFDERDRALLREATVGGLRLRVLLLKPDDVPTYTEHGATDAGIVGRDIAMERGADLYAPFDTGLGRCRLVVAAPAGSPSPDLGRALRVATKYPRVTTHWYARRGLDVEVIYVQGSVETAPLVGLSDCIVDLVETGETLRQNGLVVLDEVCSVSAVVVVNRAVTRLRGRELDAFTALVAPHPDGDTTT